MMVDTETTIESEKVTSIDNENNTKENQNQPNNNIVHPLDESIQLKPKLRFGIIYAEQSEEEVESNQFYKIPSNIDPKPFIAPRWVPDGDVLYCKSCKVEFEWIIRKHHCRHCGNIFCNKCAAEKLFLPLGFKYQDPQRVCKSCYAFLLPAQKKLLLHKTLLGHEKINYIDLTDSDLFPIRYCNLPFSATLGSEIRKASYSMHNLYEASDYEIPVDLLRQAKGIAFLTVMKGGLILGPRIGTGLVIAKLPMELGGGWSAPSAICTGGIIAGALIGIDITDYVIILNTKEAIGAFTQSGQMTFGGEIDIAIGPLGRSGSANIHLSEIATASAYSYSHTRGIYGGVSLEGTVIFTRHEINETFYGKKFTPYEILTGKIPRPRAGTPLYQALHKVLDGKEYRPEVSCDRFPPPSKAKSIYAPYEV